MRSNKIIVLAAFLLALAIVPEKKAVCAEQDIGEALAVKSGENVCVEYEENDEEEYFDTYNSDDDTDFEDEEEDSEDEEIQYQGVDRAGSFAPATEHSTGGFVTRMYKILQGRNPDPEGYNYWVGQLNSGNLSAADIVTGFVCSEEYEKRGKSNEAKVTDLYRSMQNREPDTEGKKYWVQYLNIGMTIRSVAAGFVDSAEFKQLCSLYGIRSGNISLDKARDQRYELTYFVFRLYQNCHGRRPDIDGEEYWCRELLNGRSGAEVAAGFIFSNEYKARHTGNEAFVDMLYKTIHGRSPDSGGRAYWVDRLDYQSSRESVLNGFVFSPEFNGQCQRAGISVGNAIWEPESSKDWQMNISILALCNRERESRGLTKLKTREDLWENVAMVRANELPDYFSHTRPDGRSCFTAYSDSNILYYPVGENIAYGYSGAESVVNGWMNSEGHRANILDPDFRYLATGYCERSRSYYCQNFAGTMK